MGSLSACAHALQLKVPEQRRLVLRRSSNTELFEVKSQIKSKAFYETTIKQWKHGTTHQIKQHQQF